MQKRRNCSLSVAPAERVRVLISYHYFRDTRVNNLFERLTIGDRHPDIFADSGAFSAWTQGAEVNLDEYATWLHKWKEYFSVYCNLDVIDDPKATQENQAALESMGLGPLPVWHVRSDRQVFLDLCERYSYVALGGMVGTHWKRLMPSLIWAMKESRARGTVLHGLGLTSVHPLRALPFFSVDSSSWGSGFRYGQVSVWDTKKTEMLRLRLGNKKHWTEHFQAVKRLGFDPKRFVTREATREEVAAIAALSTMYQEQAVRKRLGIVPLPPGELPHTNFGDADGVKVFMADGGAGANGAPNLEAATGNVETGGLRLYLADVGMKDVSMAVNYLEEQKEKIT